MKKLFLLAVATVIYSNVFGQIYWAKSCEISFFSPTSMENISAVNKITKPLLNIATGDLQIKIVMSAFDFPKPLMKEHFNENYAESEKFPNAFFKGKINETIDWTKDGEYKVTATGKLTIHGVEKDRTIEGIATVKGKEITLSSKFKVTFADHNIQIPFLYSGIIPEFTDVKIDAVLEPYVAPLKAKIGMTKEDVIKILGPPEKTNATETKHGKTELLFYDNLKTTININIDGKVDYINLNK